MHARHSDPSEHRRQIENNYTGTCTPIKLPTPYPAYFARGLEKSPVTFPKDTFIQCIKIVKPNLRTARVIKLRTANADVIESLNLLPILDDQTVGLYEKGT